MKTGRKRGKWGGGRNHAISPVVYHFMEKRSVTLVARRAAGRQFRRSTGTAYCESYELRNGNCAPAFRKLPDENIHSGRPVVRSPLIIE